MYLTIFTLQNRDMYFSCTTFKPMLYLFSSNTLPHTSSLPPLLTLRERLEFLVRATLCGRLGEALRSGTYADFLQIPAEQFHCHFLFFHISVQNRSHSYRTGTCSTCQCLSGTTFPHPHFYGMIIQHLRKFCIYPVRKSRMELKLRTDLFDV